VSLTPNRRRVLTERQATSGWIENGVSGTNAISLADRAGEPGRRHYITSISGAFMPHATVAQSLSVTYGTGTGGQGGPTTVGRWALADKFAITFPVPLEVPEGERVRIQLNAGGEGITGYTTVTGFSV